MHFIINLAHYYSSSMTLSKLKWLLLLLLSTIIFEVAHSINVISKASLMYPLTCKDHVQTCNSYLYHISKGLQVEEIASLYSVNASQVKPKQHGAHQDYLIPVLCTCKDMNGTSGYFYDIFYLVNSGDTFMSVTMNFYSGQAWKVAGEEEQFVPGDIVTLHLLCGCADSESSKIVTYTVQEHDTLTRIAQLLSSNLNGIENLNEKLTQNPSFIDVGWVLYVPMLTQDTRPGKQKRGILILVIVLSMVALLLMNSIILLLWRRKRGSEDRQDDNKAVPRNLSTRRSTALNQVFHRTDIEDVESDRPVIYRLEEIIEATRNFDESRKIGEGGYGSVYFGRLGEQEVAIKKMRSSRSKEFFSEIKVLCKIHHINVVELLGYASSDNHLYLVYEYVQNGSLNDHLHDPLLKGHQPLSWTARVNIALDAARGIEYIHDHTKARYVHRDIKTSNILLDQGLRAKVADFGLARLVDRSNEEEFIATSIVGTPGYIAPESVSELRMTAKGDVYAFGVVLAELITGQRALTRDPKNPKKYRSMASLVTTIFESQDSQSALGANLDSNLGGSYPLEEVHKMAEVSKRCLSEDTINRPEMKEIVQELSQILTSSLEWEASLGGKSPVFSGLINGR